MRPYKPITLSANAGIRINAQDFAKLGRFYPFSIVAGIDMGVVAVNGVDIGQISLPTKRLSPDLSERLGNPSRHGPGAYPQLDACAHPLHWRLWHLP